MFCPMFTLKEINHLEKKFLELIEYDVSVSSRPYTRPSLRAPAPAPPLALSTRPDTAVPPQP